MPRYIPSSRLTNPHWKDPAISIIFVTFFWTLSCLSLALQRDTWTQHSRRVSPALSRGEGFPPSSYWQCRGCWPSLVQGHIAVSCSSCYAPGCLSLPCRNDLHLVSHQRTLGHGATPPQLKDFTYPIKGLECKRILHIEIIYKAALCTLVYYILERADAV